jgi:hypothetical protein
MIAAEKAEEFHRHQVCLPVDAFLNSLHRLLDAVFLGLYILRSASEVAGLAPLPLYPPAVDRDRRFLVVGELHHAKPEPAEEPRWLTIPDPGLYTGIAIFGAIGSGKQVVVCILSPSRSLPIGPAMQTDDPRDS